MRTSSLHRLAGFAALLGAALSSHAADPGHPCAVVTDDGQRLACYDVAFGRPARTSPAAAVAVPAPPAAAVASVAAPPAAVIAPAVAPAAAPVAPARPAPAALPQGPVKVTAVTAISGGRHAVTLEGGSRWLQLEKDNAFELTAGETVTLRDGALGSVFLISPNGVRTRVRPAE